jgi:hypothetical protein
MNGSTTPTRTDPGEVREFIAAERARIAADASYTPSERLRLAVAFELMTCRRPTAQIKGLEVYERVEGARPGAHSAPPPATPYEMARRLQEERLAEYRRAREAGMAD